MPGLIYDELKETFPKRKREPRRVFTPRDPNSYLGPPFSDAISFLDEDEKVSILVGQDVLSVNHLEPYPTWEEFLPLIKKGVEAYRKVVKPENFQSVQLRYINDITIDTDRTNLEDYFNLHPSVGQSLPHGFEVFIAGIQVPYENSRDNLRVEVQGASSEEDSTTRVTLDLSYLLLKVEEVSLDKVFDWIETAHARIEETFEACITDKAGDMFEEVAE